VTTVLRFHFILAVVTSKKHNPGSRFDAIGVLGKRSAPIMMLTSVQQHRY
jgi:hypothetical protein